MIERSHTALPQAVVRRKERIAYIDNAKAIGIVLVVFAHLQGVHASLVDFIFSFHMPLFFFLSGYLLSDAKLALRPKEFLFMQLKDMILPYMFFGFISILFYMLVMHVKHLDFSLYHSVLGLLYGVGDGLPFNVVLWFFTCLFCVRVTYYFFSKAWSKRHVLVFSVFLAFFMAYCSRYFPFRLPWSVDVAFVALFYFAFGNFLASKDLSRYMAHKPKTVLLLIALLCLSVFLAEQNARVDMNHMAFNNIVLFFLSGSLGSVLVIALACFMPANRVSVFLSKNSIVIFPMHMLFFAMFSAIGVLIFHAEHGFSETSEFAVLYTVLVLFLSVPVSMMLRRYFPMVIGHR